MISLPAARSVISRRYDNFSGVDFTSAPALTALSRSPNAKNVCCDYTALGGRSIISRRGVRPLFTNASRISTGELSNMVSFDGSIYLHFASMLLKYSAFPDTACFRLPPEGGVSGCSVVNAGMNIGYSRFFIFRNHLYVIDGISYSKLDGTGLFDSSDDFAYVPTTMINADAGGGGIAYQGANLLTPYRINSFIGDGTSKTFYLDCQNIDGQSVSVRVNGLNITTFTVNAALGTITFSVAPPSAVGSGADNILIRFSSGVDESDRIKKCRIAAVFDNRVFLSGNPDYKGVIFHSEFEDASYFRSDAYYNDGEDEVAVKGLLASEGALLVLKDDYGIGAKVYLHTPTLDHELGKVYPAIPTSIALGAIGEPMIFNDDIVFLSAQGLEALSVSGSGRASTAHRSYFIDGKLLSGDNPREKLAAAKMCRWRNYLVLLCDNALYLADGRQSSSIGGTVQYEWFYFCDMLSGTERAVNIFEHEDKLYLSSSKGTLYVFDGDTDDGRAIESLWSTPPDDLGSSAYLKSTNVHGACVLVRRAPKGRLKLSIVTDRENEEELAKVCTAPFSFGGALDFGLLSFGTGQLGTIVFRPRKKRFRNFQLKFCSDEANHPLGLIGCDIEILVEKYTK